MFDAFAKPLIQLDSWLMAQEVLGVLIVGSWDRTPDLKTLQGTMMKAFSLKTLAATAVTACAMAGFSTGAVAQATWTSSTTYNYGTGTGTCNVPGGCAPVGGLGTLNVSGWGSYNGSKYQQGASNTTNSVGSQVYGGLTNQGGSGLGFTSVIAGKQETGASPHHGFDNSGNGNPYASGNSGNTGADNELLLLDFGSAKVNLTQIQTGWSQTDTDVMVFRWDGANKTTAEMQTLMGTTAGPGGLVAAGWNLVAAKDMDLASGTFGVNTFKLNGSEGAGFGADDKDKVSSWWLVTTYFGNDDTTNNLVKGNDYFKLLSFSAQLCDTSQTGGSTVDGNTCKKVPPPPPAVPEPASMALAGLALATLATQRRRRRLV